MEAFGRTNAGTPMDTTGKSPGSSAMLQASVLETSAAATGEEQQVSLPNIAPYIVFNPQIILYSTQPAAKRWVLQAITQSIREVKKNAKLLRDNSHS